MLLVLQRRGRVTASALAAELEVSPRTILRDVEALSAAGVPVFTTQGVHGGIELLGGFRTELTGLTDDEAAALLLAGQPAVATALGLGGASGAARRKLTEALHPGRRALVDGLDDWLLVEPTPVPVALGRLLTRLRTAIERHAITELHRGETATSVAPLGLVVDGGRWWLVAGGAGAAPGDVRRHDVARVDAVRITRGRFERPAGFDLAQVWRRLGEPARRTAVSRR